jgi:NAD(P)-dependent dehydrogenase (short-subunit alcohol dehydrogenase family)
MLRRLFDLDESELGGADVLVNNASIMQLASVANTDDALFDRRSFSSPVEATDHGSELTGQGQTVAGRVSALDHDRNHAEVG